MTARTTAAIVLARGLGTRMRREADGVALAPDQSEAAARGLKAMIPDDRGRPFLAHLLSSLADGGITDVALVVAPEHDAIADWLAAHPPRRLRVDCVVQAEPKGTADALLAAEAWTAGRDVLVLNADNLYPVEAIRTLATLGDAGLIAFDPVALVRDSNIDAARIAAFAILDVATDGTLRRIIEKPDAATLAAAGPHPWVSMNLWRFDSTIFSACRDVPRSARGEHELPEAVGLAIARGARFRVATLSAGVLDLSARGDVAAVAARLALATPTP